MGFASNPLRLSLSLILLLAERRGPQDRVQNQEDVLYKRGSNKKTDTKDDATVMT